MIYKQMIGIYTIIYREVIRMLRIPSQVFLPSVITTLLYFMIFGEVIGHRIGTIEGVSFSLFITPGLIMLAVITNAYSQTSWGIFMQRFQKNIEEILVSPLHEVSLLLGFVLSGVIRGLLTAILVWITSCFFVDIAVWSTLPMTFLVVCVAATIFSILGFINGLIARQFEDISLIPTFLLTPMTYLGGVFYSINMLSPFWKNLSYYNPIFYVVSALRHVMLGLNETDIGQTLVLLFFLIIFLSGYSYFLLKKGAGLRQ